MRKCGIFSLGRWGYCLLGEDPFSHCWLKAFQVLHNTFRLLGLHQEQLLTLKNGHWCHLSVLAHVWLPPKCIDGIQCVAVVFLVCVELIKKVSYQDVSLTIDIDSNHYPEVGSINVHVHPPPNHPIIEWMSMSSTDQVVQIETCTVPPLDKSSEW